MKFAVGIFGNQPLPQIIRRVKLAEDLGYDCAWFADLQRICRELYVEMTASALGTSRIKLGAGVTMPVTRHASVTASAFATLNEIAQGRLRAGISIGDNGLRSVGRNPVPIAELEHYVGQVRGLLQNQAVQFEGGVEGKITWLERPTDIPIYIAATGPKLTRAAGRMGDGAILLRGLTHHQMQDGVDAFRQEAEKAGKRPDQVKVSCWVQASVGPDRVQARNMVKGPVAVILSMAHLSTFDDDDHPAVRKIKEAYDPSRHSRSYVGDELQIPDKFIDMFALGGDKYDARERVMELSKVQGLDEIILAPQHVPELPGPSVEETIRYFAEEVMAHVS
ncbi:MAG: LLM class flavin-dependent oxidoreductase [Chloroflexi bacterium]|nr:LLM class flavin-dependent oxidoreductase [Chloroflexota bacterium]